MSSKINTSFLLLVIVQGLHSIEEYLGHLWDVFPPAYYLTGLIGDDRETSFIIINVGLFLIGILFWIFLALDVIKPTNKIIWFWLVIELINGIGHPIWSLYDKSYTPGLITAPVLLFLSIRFIKFRSKYS